MLRISVKYIRIEAILYFTVARALNETNQLLNVSRQVMNRFQGLPFMNRPGQQSVPGGAVPMESSVVQQGPNFSSQHTYVPPGGQEPLPDQYPPQPGLFYN